MLFKSNAKVNFGLAVREKRADGYHGIQSIVLPVYDYYDWLEIIPVQAKGVQLTTSGLKIPCDVEDNLCYKAYELLSKKYNLPGVSMHLHKIIATENGYGGGSSNAVTTLKGLIQLFGLNIKTKEMYGLAKQLGSDCPFFVKNEPSFIRGGGEVIDNIEFDFQKYRLKVYPTGIKVSTEEAYSKRHYEKGLRVKPNDLTKVSKWPENYQNAFQKHLLDNHEELRKLKPRIYEEGAVYASITGSGAGMFGLFKIDL